MKIKNDFYCRPIREGHVYELRNSTGWMTVTNYELENGLYINDMEADIGEFTNRDVVEDMNVFGTPIITSGAAEMSMEDGSRFNYIAGTSLFGGPNSKRLKMKVTSNRIAGLNMIYTPKAEIPVYGDDPDVPHMLASLRDRLGTGLNRPFRVPELAMVVTESVKMEIASNRCRNTAYIGKRAAQLLHVLYNMGEIQWAKPVDVADNPAVDRVCRLLMDFENHRTVKDVCEQEGVDMFWFIHNFKRRYDMRPTEFVVRAKHIHAAALLLTGKYTVKDVMEDVGYSSKSMFLKAFRRVHGCNPGEYAARFDQIVELYPEMISDQST